MNEIRILGIDLAKDVFQVHGADRSGKALLKKKLRRKQLAGFVETLSRSCLIGMEACGGAHHWARLFQAKGFQVRLISPQFVKPFVKTNKNDAADAEAIVEAVCRPSMRFVPIKQIWQHDVQSVHRVRTRLVRAKIALRNEIRGLLAEYGVVAPRGLSRLRSEMSTVIDPGDATLSQSAKALMGDLLDELTETETRIKALDAKIADLSSSDSAIKRIQAIKGVGPITASAMRAAIGDGKCFKNGRQVSAWLGLVPRQNSSGGKTTLLGISKRGDVYLRSLLVHGARAVIRHAAANPDDPVSQWALKKSESRGFNKATVALANKNARIIWALITKNEEYRTAA